MKYFEEVDGKVIFRGNGETVQVETWGQDSLRVRAKLLEGIGEESIALLPQPFAPVLSIFPTTDMVFCYITHPSAKYIVDSTLQNGWHSLPRSWIIGAQRGYPGTD